MYKFYKSVIFILCGRNYQQHDIINVVFLGNHGITEPINIPVHCVESVLFAPEREGKVNAEDAFSCTHGIKPQYHITLGWIIVSDSDMRTRMSFPFSSPSGAYKDILVIVNQIESLSCKVKAIIYSCSSLSIPISFIIKF